MNKKGNNISNPVPSKYSGLRPLWIGLFIDILGFYIIIPYQKQLVISFNSTISVLMIVLATNAVFSLFSAPIWGKLSDKYGRRPILLIAEAGTFTAFLLLASSSNLEWLFIARIVDGIFGGNFPITKAIITDTVPPKDRGVQMSNLGVVHTFAGLIAPALGGFLAVIPIFPPEYPLALPGLVAAVLSFLTMIVTYFFIEESWPKSLRERAEKEIKISVKIRKNKDATYLLTQYLFHTLSFMMYVGSISIFIGFILGLDTFGISMFLLISGISRAIVRFTIFKPTMKLLGERNTTIFGLVILAMTFFLVGIFGYFFHSELWIFVVLVVLGSYGVTCARPLMMSKITLTVSHKERGKINGMTSTMDSIGQAFLPILGGFLIQLFPTYWFGIVMGALALVALIMMIKKITPMQAEGFSVKMSENP
jgi:MFS family permease